MISFAESSLGAVVSGEPAQRPATKPDFTRMSEEAWSQALAHWLSQDMSARRLDPYSPSLYGGAMTIGTDTVPVIGSIKELGSSYAAWLVDIWGVMHNGVRAYAPAVEATRRFREQGGLVVLLSNSPRPSEGLQHQLRSFGVPDQCYDATVSSGDLTRHELAKHPGARIFHLGPERDLPVFAGLDVARVDAERSRARGVHRPVRRRDRDAGRLPARC